MTHAVEPRVRFRPVTIIEPRRPGIGQRLVELWHYRWLIVYFGHRFLQKRYARTWLGWVWIPLRPAVDVTSRALLFGGLLAVPSTGLPYLLFFLVGVSAWQVLDRTAYWATRSLELSRSVFKRMYVPRLTAVCGAVVPSFVDYLLYMLIAIIVVIYYRVTTGVFYVELSARTLWALVGLAMLLLIVLSVGIWLAPFAARARDIRFGLAYALGPWFFVTPVIYPLGAVPSPFEVVAYLNPATAPIELVKFGLLGTGGIPGWSLVVSVGFLCLVIPSGLMLFARIEAAAVDSL
jgi:lipopolysaccharide transport system permease protein